MSLGGIAVAIGAMVDASIILIENIHEKLGEHEEEATGTRRVELIIEAMQEVAPSIFFSLLVITVSFLPVFTLEGTEGRLFKPLAFTKTYSMGFAAILAATLTPALAAILIHGKVLKDEHNLLNRFLVAAYTPVVIFVSRYRKTVIGLAIASMVLTVPAFPRLGSEFMPPLNEGVILYMPTAPPGMSMTETSRVLQQMDRELKEFPEVVSVFGKMGRARTATDPAPIGMAETVVVLKSKDEWHEGLTRDKLVAEMDEKLRYPGMPNIWWMPIQTRTEMLATGIRSPLGIQVFGDDLAELERSTIAIEQAVDLRLAYDRHAREGQLNSEADLEEAIVEGAAKRVRLKLMTVMTTMIGLLPVLWGTGTGADVTKRIAAPVVGGLVSPFFLELTVYPAIFPIWKRRSLPKAAEVPIHPEASEGEKQS